MGWPVGYAVARYVNDRDLGIDLAGVLGNVPAGLPRTQIYVGNNRAKSRVLSVEHLDGSIPGWSKGDLKSSFFQRAFHQVQDKHLVFND
jgi:hypothetical protein